MASLLQRAIKKLAYRQFDTAKAYEVYRLAKSRGELNNPIVIYQMGKVGSSTMIKSLRALDRNLDVYQVHVLTHDSIKETEGQYRHAARQYKRIRLDSHLIESMYLRRALDNGAKKTRWKVVTFVRDPIARNVSSFFEAYKGYFPEFHLELMRSGAKLEDSIPRLVEVFLDRFDHETPVAWFDKYFKPVFDFDIYDAPFPKDRGYNIYAHDFADILLLRQEDLGRCAPEAIGAFLGIDDFKLINANVSADKAYAAAYEKFKNSIRFPAAYLERMYDSRYIRHFYTPAEIEKFRSRWRVEPKTA